MKILDKSLRKLGAPLCLCFLFAVSSCDEDKYLQKVPPTQISDADAFTTPARIEGLVNGTYASLKNSNFLGSRFLLYMDLGGEDFINTGSNSFTGYDAWNHSYSSGAADILNAWSAGYTTINRANILIDGLAVNTGVVNAATATQYVAEAKFLRALTYYTLVTTFAQPFNKDNGASPGIPLRLQGETTPANNDLARSTVAEVYTQILTDLNDAERDLPASYSSALLNTTRAHKSTAIALKTRVYLSQGNYAKVSEEAKKIVPQNTAPFSAPAATVAHSLQSDIVALFATNYTTTESIFSMPFTTNDQLGGQSALGYIYRTIPDYHLSWDGILNNPQWTSTDKRRGVLELNASADASKGGRTYLIKFGSAAPFLRYTPLIRYAEVLLNYAEAEARRAGGDLALSEALLKAVHGRSDNTYVFPAFTQTSLLNAILLERRIELLGEGFRTNDILRQVIAFPAKAGTLSSTPAVTPTAPNYIWPMSNDELLYNKLINQ